MSRPHHLEFIMLFTYLLELSHYTVLNLVKAGVVKQAGDWKWSSFQAMTGMSEASVWLSNEYFLLQFSKQRKIVIRKYIDFVEEGIHKSSIWSDLTTPIYHGDADFIDKVQSHMSEKGRSINIPDI